MPCAIALGILLVITLAGFVVGDGRKTQRRFQRLGNMTGMSRNQVISAVGKPASTVRTANGSTVCAWVGTLYSITVVFTPQDVFRNIANETASGDVALPAAGARSQPSPPAPRDTTPRERTVATCLHCGGDSPGSSVTCQWCHKPLPQSDVEREISPDGPMTENDPDRFWSF
jgi:hypothetical protein